MEKTLEKKTSERAGTQTSVVAMHWQCELASIALLGTPNALQNNLPQSGKHTQHNIHNSQK